MEKGRFEQIDQTNPVTKGSTALVYKQTTFEENNPEQLREFLYKFRMLIDEYHPNIYTMDDLFKGVDIIEVAVLNKLNIPNS